MEIGKVCEEGNREIEVPELNPERAPERTPEKVPEREKEDA